jgi:hypothetical protein
MPDAGMRPADRVQADLREETATTGVSSKGALAVDSSVIKYDGGYFVTAPVFGDFEPEPGVLDTPFELGPGLWIAKRPEWFSEKALPPQESIGSSARFLARSASYVLVIERPNTVLREDDLAEDAATLRLMQHSLWVASGVRVEWHLVFYIVPGAPGPCPFAGYTARTAPLESPDRRLSQTHLDQAKSFHAAIQARESTALWTAFRMASVALDQQGGDVAIVLLWSGLEALFGPESGSEIAYQMSLSIALFLSQDRATAAILAKRVKESYGLRCKVVHGRARGLAPKDKPAEAESALALLSDTIFWLRESLRRIGLDPSLQDIFNSKKKRVEYLSALPFTGRQLTTT